MARGVSASHGNELPIHSNSPDSNGADCEYDWKGWNEVDARYDDMEPRKKA